MTTYNGFLLATAGGAAALAAGGAQAADMPMKAAPIMAPTVYSWEGLYGGVNVGAAWTHGSGTNASKTSVNSGTAFIGGGQIGYNWQHRYFVYGLEADISGLTRNGKLETDPTGTGKGPRQNNHSINWLSTVRGRAGLAVEDTMVYLTGGIAFGGVKNEFNVNGANADPCCTKSESKTRVGWTLGGGIEHMWNRNWTIGLEGLFVDLGHSSVIPVNTGGTPQTEKTTRFSNQAVIGRFKVNYKF